MPLTVDIQYNETQAEHAINRKQLGVMYAGRYLGFETRITTDMNVEVVTDGGESTALVATAAGLFTVRDTVTSGVFSIPADAITFIALEVVFQDDQPTTVALVATPTLTNNMLVLATLNVPPSTTELTDDMLMITAKSFFGLGLSELESTHSDLPNNSGLFATPAATVLHLNNQVAAEASQLLSDRKSSAESPDVYSQHRGSDGAWSTPARWMTDSNIPEYLPETIGYVVNPAFSLKLWAESGLETIHGHAFSNAGRFYYLVGTNPEIVRYELGIPFDVRTRFNRQTFPISNRAPSPTDIAVSEDGKNFLVSDEYSNLLSLYQTTVPGDLSTMSFTKDRNIATTNIQGFGALELGSRLYIVIAGDNDFFNTDLTFVDLGDVTAGGWQLNAALYSFQFNHLPYTPNCRSMEWSKDGRKVFLLDNSGTVAVFDMLDPFFGADRLKYLDTYASNFSGAQGITFTGDGKNAVIGGSKFELHNSSFLRPRLT